MSLLPEDLRKNFSHYKSKGSIAFSSTMRGKYSEGKNPEFDARFSADKASFYHPKYRRGIQDAHFTGTFHAADLGNIATYSLRLNDLSLLLEERPLTGHLHIDDFKNPVLDARAEGTVDVNLLLDFFPDHLIRAAQGKVRLDLRCKGRTADLKSSLSRQNFKADGEIELENVSFILRGERLPFNGFNGSFMLKDADLGVSNFRGEVGNSDFRLNGFFKNILPYLFSNDSRFYAEADLSARTIDLDELLKTNFASKDTTASQGSSADPGYTFKISPALDINFNCNVQHVKLKRFKGRKVRGSMKVRNRMAVFDELSFEAMGGRVSLSGTVTNRRPDMVEILTDASLKRLDIDSIFYVFKNFRQNWIVDRHLKGQIDSDVNLYLSLDEHLKFNPPSLIADITARVVNGELVDFEPMQKLSRFVEEESLAHLRFSDMQNRIRVERETVFLPEMEIRSNLTNISVRGTHTFDQHIDYHLAVPLKTLIRFGKKKENASAPRNGSNLLLKITGTTDDYKVAYDFGALKEKLRQDFSDEGQEWRSIFNKKKSPAKEEEAPLEPKEDEYFQFE